MKKQLVQKKNIGDYGFYLGVMAMIATIIIGYYTYTQVSGNTTINTTVISNPNLDIGLRGHWTFDGKDFDTSGGLTEARDRGPLGKNGNINHPTLSYVQATSTATEDTDPTGIAFNTDGTKMFVVGGVGDDIGEYNLSPGFDVSTATYVDATSTTAQDDRPESVAFNTDGTKMFVVGSFNDSIYEYNLSPGFDVSTASYVDATSTTAQDVFPRAVAFNTDGTKMFVVGNSNSGVSEYSLSSGFDVSTASFVITLSVGSQALFPSGIAFNTDGTKMFVLGTSADDVNLYTLSTGFDISTASYVDDISVTTEDTNPEGIAFNTDGTKMFVVGSTNSNVYEYTLQEGFVLFSIDVRPGRIGQALQFDGTDDYVDFKGVSGPSFVDATSTAAQDTTPNGIAFNGDGTKMFVLGGQNDSVYEYTLSSGFDISTASYVDATSTASEDDSPTDIAFNTDGTKMFVVGGQNDSVYEYTLSSGFDVSTASYVDATSTASEDDIPTGLAFNTDGTKMYVTGNRVREVSEYSLNTGFDISTASFTDFISVISEDTSPSDVAFNTDGTKMFVVGNTGNDVGEYTLSPGFDASTATFVDNFIVATEDTTPTGIAFNTDGTKMFVVGSSFDNVNEYTLTTAFDIGIPINTVAFWMKTGSTTQKIFDFDGTDQIEVIGGTITATSFPGTTVIYVDGNQSSTITAGDWHHIVITDTTGVNASTFTTGIVGSNFYDGFLDDVRTYERVLPADEITRLYQLGATTKINTSINTNPDLENGLVGHWTFDGKNVAWGDTSTEIKDRSGSGNDGDSVSIASTAVRPGKIGQAIEFDAVDDFINAGSDASLDDLSNMTLSAWIRPGSAGEANWGIIMMKAFARTADGWGLQYPSDVGGTIKLRFSVDYDTTNLVVVTDGVFDYDEWHHVIVTWDGSATAANVHIYKNGEEVGYNTQTNASGSRLSDAAQPLTIGAEKDNDDAWDGILDDVRIYDRVLSQEEVTRLYELGATTKINKTITTNDDLENGLVGHWTFDGSDIDTSSGTAEVLDRSGNNNHGDWRDHATTTRPGKIGQAIDFDGVDDSIGIIGDSSTLHMTDTQSMTFSAWMKLDALVPSSEHMDIIRYDDGDNSDGDEIFSRNLYLFRVTDAEKLQLQFGSTAATLSDVTSNTVLSPNEWYHVVGVRNVAADTESIYINGTLDMSETDASTGTWETTGQYVVLGRYDDASATDYFDGLMDDIRIYNRALSADEVERLYQLGS